MENFAKKCKWSFLLTAVGLFAFFSCGKLDKTENLVDLQESYVRGEAAVNITGTVTDPETCLPLANATVSSGSFTTTTDGNGHFTIDAANVGSSEFVQVTKEGYINYEFPVSYSGITDANWMITLPKLEQCVWVGPNEGAWYRITVSGVEYIIDIRRGSVDAWTQVCVGPGGTAYGTGVPLAWAVTGLNTQTPGAEDIVFNNPIDVRYNAIEAAGAKGGIGSVNAGNADLAASLAALLAGGNGSGVAGAVTPQDIGNLLYGANNFEISPSGQFILFINLPSNFIPPAGFVFNGLLFVPTPGGLIVTDGNLNGGVSVIDVNTGDIGNDIPHQGTGGG